jgi:DNA-binding PadR family transcriptional regulator
MPRTRRPSAQTAAVLQSLARRPREWRYGYDLCQELDLKAGSMYPILMRLADRALLETSWEKEPEPGRPPRHLYRLTRAGQQLVAELKAESKSVSALRMTSR